MLNYEISNLFSIGIILTLPAKKVYFCLEIPRVAKDRKRDGKLDGGSFISWFVFFLGVNSKNYFGER